MIMCWCLRPSDNEPMKPSSAYMKGYFMDFELVQFILNMLSSSLYSFLFKKQNKEKKKVLFVPFWWIEYKIVFADEYQWIEITIFIIAHIIGYFKKYSLTLNETISLPLNMILNTSCVRAPTIFFFLFFSTGSTRKVGNLWNNS